MMCSALEPDVLSQLLDRLERCLEASTIVVSPMRRLFTNRRNLPSPDTSFRALEPVCIQSTTSGASVVSWTHQTSITFYVYEKA